MENRNMNSNAMDDIALEAISGGAEEMITSGGYYVSGSAPRFSVGQVVRTKYCLSDGKNCRAKCLVQGVNYAKNAGPSGQEFSYTLMVLWLPASCAAAATDVGRVFYNVCESCMEAE